MKKQFINLGIWIVYLIFLPLNSFIFGEPLLKNIQFQYALDLYQKNDHYRALSELLTIKNNSPTIDSNNTLDLYIVKCYYRLQEYQKAQELITKILQNQLISIVEKNTVQKLETLIKLQQLSMQDIKNQTPIVKSLQIDSIAWINPDQAKLYSTILPGAGFIVTKEYNKAWMAFLLNALFITTIYQQFHDQNYSTTFLLFFFEIGWYQGGRNAAYESAQKYNQKLLNQNRQSWIQNYERNF